MSKTEGLNGIFKSALLAALVFLTVFCIATSFTKTKTASAAGRGAIEYYVFTDEDGNFVVQNLTTDKILFKNSKKAPERMKEAIIADSGGNEYVVTAQAPRVSLSAAGDVTEMDYSDGKGIILNAAYDTDVLFGDVKATDYNWYYKLDDGDETNGFVQIQNSVKSFEFGSKLAAGKYLVKVEIASAFTVEAGGRSFKSKTGSASISLSVNKNQDVNFSYPKPSPAAVYGKKLSQIKLIDSSNSGTWTLSASEDGALVPEPGRYEFKYNFKPSNPNYSEHKDVKVIFDVSKINLRIFIPDVSTLQDGEYVAPSYVIDKPGLILSGDSAAELGISLSTVNDTKIAGSFDITGSLEHPHYQAQFYNAENTDNVAWSVPGTYTVLPVRVSKSFANGISVTISNSAGMPVGTDISLSREDREGITTPKYTSLYAYNLNMSYPSVDAEGNEITLPYAPSSGESLTVRLSGLGNAERITYVYGTNKTNVDIENGGVEFTASALGTFYGLQAVPEEDWNWVTVFLAVVAASLSAAVAYLAVKLKRSRR